MDELSYADRLRLEVLEEERAKYNATAHIDYAKAFLDEATADIPWQKTFLEDTNSHKALFGERRGAKTTCMAIDAVYTALKTPYSKILYIGLTQDACERVMYNEILARLLRNHSLPAKLVNGDQMKFDNGSIIYLIGLDANKKEKDKLRGVKSSLNIVDEMQSYTQDIQLIINEIIGPAAADTKASTILGGTAGDTLSEKNYWYEITKDNTKEEPISYSTLHPEWIVYRCSWENNTAIDENTNKRVCDNVREYLNEQKSKHPGIELTDSWRQEWDAEWIVRTSALIYKYTEANLLTSPLCTEIDSQQRIPMPSAAFLSTASYILGVDLGYNDPTSMTVIAYNLAISNKLYVIETFNKSEMLVPEVADKIRSLDSHYHFRYMVGDSSSLQVFETMLQTYSLPIRKANRTGKLSHQLVLNSDLQTRSIVIMPGNEELVRQLKTCIWESKALKDGRHVEDPKYKNDLTDSFLYAHHFSRHLWYEAPKPKLGLPTNQDQYEQMTKKLIEASNDQYFNIDFSDPNRNF